MAQTGNPATPAVGAPAPDVSTSAAMPRLRRLLGVERRHYGGRLNQLGSLLAEELRPQPGRLRYALRTAVVIALGAGLMAALAIAGPMGPYVLQGVAGGPSAITPAAAGILTAAQAVAGGTSLAIIGVLVEAPWLFLAFFAVIGAILTYAMMRGPFTAGKWLYVEIAFLNSFFLVLFDPTGVGWSVAYTCAGGAAAFAVAMAFDNWLWPVPAEPEMVLALVNYLKRVRGRLSAAGESYLNPAIAAPRSTAVSEVPALLALLSRADDEGLDLRRHTMLMAAVTLAERLKIEVERLLVITQEAAAPRLRLRLAAPLREMLEALQASITCHIEHLTSMSSGGEDPALHEAGTRVARALDTLLEAMRELMAAGGGDDTAELSNLSSFVIGLRRLARLLERPVDELPLPAAGARPAPARGASFDPEALVHAVKVSIAMTIGLLLVLVSQHGELDTVSLTVMITALPSYGATLRKANLRLAGAVLGAGLALAAMIVVTPNFASLGSYITALFVVSLLAAYVGQSSPRLAYFGKQMGVTFILTYVGLAPAADIYRPLYRILGVLLGIVVVAAVFLLIAPNYSAQALIVRVRKLLRATLDLLPANVAAGTLTLARMESMHIEVARLLGELLAVADDARLEGTRSGINADQVVHGCGTLRRLSLRVSDLSRWYLAGRPIPPRCRELLGAFEAALRTRLEYWLDYAARLAVGGRPSFPAPAPPGPEALEARYEALRQYFAGPGLREVQSLAAIDQAALLAQIESCGRLVVLVRELDEQLSLIPHAWSAAVMAP
jgi:uncharacterized membrane protein YccC